MHLYIGLGLCAQVTGSTVVMMSVSRGILTTTEEIAKDFMLAHIVRKFPASEGYINHESYASKVDAATIRAAFAALPPEPSKP